MNEMNRIKKAVKKIAENKGLGKQVALASASNLEQSHISQFYSGRRKNIQVSTLIKICSALGIDIVSFIEEGGSQKIPEHIDLAECGKEAAKSSNVPEEEKMEILYLALNNIQFGAPISPLLIWEKCLHGFHEYKGLRELAGIPHLWSYLMPSSGEIKRVIKLFQRKRHADKNDWFLAVWNTREEAQKVSTKKYPTGEYILTAHAAEHKTAYKK